MSAPGAELEFAKIGEKPLPVVDDPHHVTVPSSISLLALLRHVKVKFHEFDQFAESFLDPDTGRLFRRSPCSDVCSKRDHAGQ
ncbi:hypothetical protein CEQ30_41055 [Nocardia brasiliensis]|nr:hypothetical protein CEQ30_41055 [Nocardia brasiliensis]